MQLRALLGTASAAAVFFLGSVASAQVELKNDGFVDMGSAGFQQGFVIGEMGASRFSPPQAGVQLLSIQLLFGGGAEGVMRDVTLHIYDDSAGTDDPGAELFSADYQLSASDMALQEIDLSADNVIVPSQFRVAIEFQHAGAPSIARDDDGTITSSKNFIMAQGIGWVKSSTLGLTGDWVIRAYVEDGGNPTTTSSSSTGSSMGNGGAGAGGSPSSGGAPGVGGSGSGDECNSNADCPAYQYCGPSNTCTFDCRAEADCASGQTCNSLGQCVGNDDGGCSCTLAGDDDPSSAAPWLALGALGVSAMVVSGRRQRRARR
ncbi:MAG: dickkopf-related protein [Polyangiaceae bacterium]